MNALRVWATRGVVVYQWPAPAAFLFTMVAITNPEPFLLFPDGSGQRFVFTAAAVFAWVVTIFPRHLWTRNLSVLASTVACGWRVATLLANPGIYNAAEVTAYATVWAVIALLLIQMTVLTWPTVSLGKLGKVPKR